MYNYIFFFSTEEGTLLSETSGYICIIIVLSLSVREKNKSEKLAKTHLQVEFIAASQLQKQPLKISQIASSNRVSNSLQTYRNNSQKT